MREIDELQKYYEAYVGLMPWSKGTTSHHTCDLSHAFKAGVAEDTTEEIETAMRSIRFELKPVGMAKGALSQMLSSATQESFATEILI